MNKLLFVTLVLLSPLTFAGPLPSVPHIYVEGQAEIEVEPDMMNITVGLEATDMDVAVAKKTVDQRSHKLIKTCKDMGIKSKDISTTALQVFPQYDYRDGQRVLTGTRVSRQVDITLNDLDKYPEFMQALMDAKISRTVNTGFAVKDMKSILDKAQIRAVENARSRAQGLAAAVNKTVADVYSISEFQTRTDIPYILEPAAAVVNKSPRAAGTVMMRNAVPEPFEPGMMTVSATVYVVFLLN